MGVAEKWSVLNSPELIKLYGFTLSSPATYVIESMKQGPLDEFLRNHNDINVGCMIDAAHSLARALHYLVSRPIHWLNSFYNCIVYIARTRHCPRSHPLFVAESDSIWCSKFADRTARGFVRQKWQFHQKWVCFCWFYVIRACFTSIVLLLISVSHGYQ